MIYINKRIIEMCEKRGWTTYTLANKADITHSTLNSAINRDAAPKIETLQRICEAFGITLAQFFVEDEQLEILTMDEKELVSDFRKLSDDKKKALLALLKE